MFFLSFFSVGVTLLETFSTVPVHGSNVEMPFSFPLHGFFCFVLPRRSAGTAG